MRPRILLVNPPVYDFSAYDFWLKPLGLLSLAGRLRGAADMKLFDFLDRLHPAAADIKPSHDEFGRGHYLREKIEKPPQFAKIQRFFNRFGLPTDVFRRFLAEESSFDAVFVQTTMTYWYLGVAEVINELRRLFPDVTIVLGGFYAETCPEHATNLGADMVVRGDVSEVFDRLGVTPGGDYQVPFWEGYNGVRTGVIRLGLGCPFACTYCRQGQKGRGFVHRPLEECVADLHALLDTGVGDIAFYDDALLYRADEGLVPFLRYVIDNRIKVNFHTPNALAASMVTDEIAEVMVEAGFKTFFLGFESFSEGFQRRTGGKVSSGQLESALASLVRAGTQRSRINAYVLLGHPRTDEQQVEETMRFVNGLGIRLTLSDFSPIPGTPDGELCRRWVDLDEPLNHNKTSFPIHMLGNERVDELKGLRQRLNRSLS